MTIEIDNLHSVYGHNLALSLARSRLVTQRLFKKTTLFEFAHNTLIDQPVQIDFTYLRVAYFHKALNISQPVDNNERPPVRAPHVIFVSILGSLRVGDAKLLRHDFHDGRLVGGIQKKSMALDQSFQRIACHGLMGRQVVPLHNNARADQRDSVHFGHEIVAGPFKSLTENTREGRSLDRAGFQSLADDPLVAEGGKQN